VWADTIWDGDSVTFTDSTIVHVVITRFTVEGTILTEILVVVGVLSEWTFTFWGIFSGWDTNGTVFSSVFTFSTLCGARDTSVS
jgi:hypothetical protein